MFVFFPFESLYLACSQFIKLIGLCLEPNRRLGQFKLHWKPIKTSNHQAIRPNNHQHVWPSPVAAFFHRCVFCSSLLADHVSPGCLAHHIIRHQFIRVTQSYKNVPTLSRNKRWLKNNINGICTVLLQIWAVIHAFWYYNFWQIFNSVLGFHFLQLCLPAGGCEPRAGL